jgi:hypothetical protein
VVHSCPLCRRFLTFQRKETLVPDLTAGHWYGCPGCARNVCDTCGQASGRRCLECGDTLEPDQFFPEYLRPQEDWRSLVSGLLEDPTFIERTSVELIACVTETSIHDIDAAFDDWTRDRFRWEVFSWDIERRLGTSDACDFLGSGELRWTPEWERRLSVAAGYYLERADEATRDALRQRESMREWNLLRPASPLPVKELLALVLHPDKDVAEGAVRMLLQLENPLLDVLDWCVPVLRSGDVARVRLALSALGFAIGRSTHLNARTRREVEQRLCTALAGCGEAELEAIVRRIASSPGPHPADVTASLAGALGLADEVVSLLSAALASRRPGRADMFHFIAAMGAPAASAHPLVLEYLERAESHEAALPPLLALGRMGTQAHELLALAERWLDSGPVEKRLEALRVLVELQEERGDGGSAPLRDRCQRLAGEARTPEERLGLIRLVSGLSPASRQALLPTLPEPAELLTALLEDTEDEPPSLIDLWVERHHDSPRLRAWLLEHARKKPRDSLSSCLFKVAGPGCGGLLLLLQRLIADRSASLYERDGWIRALGRIAPGPDSPALRMLVTLLLDTRERLDLRLTAARTLWSAGVRDLPGTELAPALRDRSAAIRLWTLLLAGEVEEGLLASLREDPVPLVRRVATGSVGASAPRAGGADDGRMP